jgi:mRNA interferase HigB
VRVIARSTLVRFVAKLSGHKDHRAVKAALDAWFHEVQRSEWKNSSDVKASYTQASIIAADWVVFNIKGNSYRLVTAVDYHRGIVFIKWLGNHKEYNAIDVRTVKYASKAD